MKYIDTGLLKSKLKDIATEFKTGNYYLDNTEQAVGYENALIDFEQIIDSLQQDDTQVNKMLCSQIWWEEQGWIMIPPDATIEGIDSLLKQVRKKLQQKQPKVDLVAELKHHLATTPKEQLEKEWKELEPWSNIGPTVQEFLYGKQPNVDYKIEERKWVHDAVDNIFPEDGDFMSEVDFRKILKDTARHFYELGLKSK